MHRDVKPENVAISDDGYVKVLDFGIVKHVVHAGHAGHAGELAITAQGFTIGTPRYMAPEQMRGEALDGRADQFAWGVMAYELLAQELPWTATADALKLVSDVLSREPVPLATKNPAIPAAVAAAVMRALAKSRDQRFATMDELAAMMAAIVAAAADAAARAERGPPVPRRGRRADRARHRRTGVDRRAAVRRHARRGRPGVPVRRHRRGGADRAQPRRRPARLGAELVVPVPRAELLDARTVGARLGVDAVLEGAVRKAGDRLRVTVQLIDVAAGFQRWSHRFDGTVADVFAIQDDIAAGVATRLRGQLSPSSANALHRPATTPEACWSTSCAGAAW